MTANQIAYQNMLEARRTNRAKEIETQRSNLAKEAENLRSNKAKENENFRHNINTEEVALRQLGLSAQQIAEVIRHNKATEGLSASQVGVMAQQLSETIRSNLSNEAIRWATQEEAARHQQAQDAEANRHNMAVEHETQRANLTNARVQYEGNDIQRQHNEDWRIVNEYTTQKDLVNSGSRLLGDILGALLH